MTNKYAVIMTCRNGEDTIKQAIQSWLKQTISPCYIIVINDGSTDNSESVIRQTMSQNYTNIPIAIISNPLSEYDVKRIPINWNKGLEYLERQGTKYDYHVIATEDSTVNIDYATLALELMNINTNIFACSGQYLTTFNPIAPHGIARFIRKSIFQNMRWKGRYPYTCGYESAILYEAIRIGHINSITNGHMQHLRPLGKNHGFKEWYIASKLLGFSTLYFTVRILKLAINKQMSLQKAISLSIACLLFKPDKQGYYSNYPNDLRQYVKQLERNKIKEILRLQ